MRILELHIGDKTERYEIPTAWNEVSIGQYSKLMTVIEQIDDISEIEAVIRTLTALIGISSSQLSKVPVRQLKEAYAELGTLTSTMPNNELKKVIEIKGKEYGFIPDFDNLTMGEFADLDTYLQDSWSNLDKILAVLYRPVTGRKKDKYLVEHYSLDDIKERRELFRDNMSIDTAYGSIVFFYTIGSELTDTMLCSLSLEVEKKKKMIKMLVSVVNMVGMLYYTS